MHPHRQYARTLRGPLVPLFAAFGEDESIDIDSTCKWVDWLIRGGLRIFWTTYGTTHFMCLTDAEVLDLTRALAQVTRGRATLIASTPRQWATTACIEFVDFAAKCGADIVKLQIDWGFTFTPDQLMEHYGAIAARSPLPLFAYTLGAAGVDAPLLKRIIDIPQFIGMKNDTDDFYGQEKYLATVRRHASVDEFHVVTGGGLSSVSLTYDLGVRVYGDTTPWFSPALSLKLHEEFQRGGRGLVNRFLTEIEEPLFFEEWPKVGAGGHWTWGHVVAWELGLFKSAQVRFPLPRVKPEDVAGARAFLKRLREFEAGL